MRIAAGLVLLALGLLLLGGPVFGAIAALSGHELFIRGGAARVTFDLVVGGALLAAGVRTLRRTALA